MIRINKNESPIRSLSEEQLTEIIKQSKFHEYPDEEYDAFIQAYGDYHGFKPECLSAANGSDEWIQKCMITLGKGPVLTINPDFVMYTEYAAQIKRNIHFVDCDENFYFNLEEIIRKIETLKPSFFICSQPNNPTGRLFSDEFVQTISDKMAEVGGYFVLDEAYIEFASPYRVPQGKHVIRMRTMSKIYGFAGLRIGVVITHPETIALLNSVHHPYPINTLSLQIATYLLNNQKQLDEFFEYQKMLSQKLNDIFLTQKDVIDMIPSETNFIMTYGKNAVSLGEYIESKGFLPRTYPGEPILKDVVRYSITTEDNLELLSTHIQEWRAEYDRTQ